MQISSISDVHIKVQGDNQSVLLNNFFKHEKVKQSDYIILNGDIFDILIGGKSQYLKKYEEFFFQVKELTENGSVVIYIEGNHDFHIEKLISDSLKKFDISEEKFIHVKNSYSLNINKKLVLFTHGDDVEIDNDSYKSYKAKINNPFMKFLGDYIVPFSLIEWIGHRTSDKSRQSNISKYELSKEGMAFVQDKFRKSSNLFFESHPEVDFLVCGHSHCKDLHQNENGKVYINNGYAPSSNSFIFIDENGARFIDL